MFVDNSKYLEIAGDIPSKARKKLLHEKKKCNYRNCFFFKLHLQDLRLSL